MAPYGIVVLQATPSRPLYKTKPTPAKDKLPKKI